MEGTVFYFDWEVTLMELLQSGMGSALTLIMSVITLLGEEAVAIGVLVFLYWVWDKEAAVFAGTNVLVGSVFNPFLKNFALRRRPYFDHETIKCLKPVHEGDIYNISAQGYSFPSGHSSNSAILFGSLALVRKFAGRHVSASVKDTSVTAESRTRSGILYTRPRLWTSLAIALPFLVGLSRVMLGVHYPTDVLAGWVSGSVIILVLSNIQSRIRNKAPVYLVIVVLFLPGFLVCKTNDFYTCYGILCGFFLGRVLDDRYIRFENTRNVRAAVLRIVIGLFLFGALNVLFKLPFSEEFLQSATTGQFVFRAVRYFLISFLMLGLYPMAFQKVKWLR